MVNLSCGLLHKLREFIRAQSLGGSGIAENKHKPAETLGAQDHNRKPNLEKTPVPTSISPPFIDVALPRVLSYHQPSLAYQGWTTITYDEPSDTLKSSAAALLQASKAFFDLPESRKQAFKTKRGSEEGWCCIEGEKEFITLRSLDRTPEELRDAGTAFWAQAGGLLNDSIGRIAESLGLPAEKLTVFSEPCKELGHVMTSTMLRLFKYEGCEGQQPHIVAEPHKDLGLLSLVIGDSPGLEVWNPHYQQWFPVERSYTQPAGTLLVGRQLEQFSNSTYRAGGHLVRSYPNPAAAIPEKNVRSSTTKSEEPQKSKSECRYSIVFVLRAHNPVPVNTDELTTTITGPFSKPIKDVTVGEMFRELQKLHFNINTGVQQREEQKRKLAEKKNTEA